MTTNNYTASENLVQVLRGGGGGGGGGDCPPYHPPNYGSDRVFSLKTTRQDKG